MGDKPANAHSLPVDKYRHEVDDFDVWVTLFEDAVGLAHNVDAGPARDALCIRWLPLKIDESARAVRNNCKETEWAKIKVELSGLLTDPQEKYDWVANRDPITWNGAESFHALGTRIKRKVDKYEEPGSRAKEYFVRFRAALPLTYRRAIDIGCDNWDIDEAKKVASKIRLADSDAAAGGEAAPKAVSFKGAAMSDDRIKSLELGMQGMSVDVGNMKDVLKECADGVKELRRSRDESRKRHDVRSPSRDGGRRGSGERYRDFSRDSRRDDRSSRSGRRDDRYNAYSDSRDSSWDQRRRSPSEYRRDSRDRDYRSGRDSRYDSRDRGRYDSQDRGRYNSRDRGRYDSRDRGRYDSRDRGRYDSRDRGRYDSRDRGRYDSRDRGRYDNRDRGRYESRDREDRRPRRDDQRDDRRSERRDDRRDDRRDNRNQTSSNSNAIEGQVRHLALTDGGQTGSSQQGN